MPNHHKTTRRGFLRDAGLLSLATSLPAGRMLLNSTPAAAEALHSSPVVRNRAPLSAGAFCFLPLGSVRPQGWLKRQLEIQAAGLGGHLDETWADVGPESGWLGGKGESWERGPYFLDGLVPLAWLLDDARLKAKAQRYMDWVLTSQQANGMIGPASNDDWWPRFVILKALTQYQEFSGDERVIPLMDRYFRFQLTELTRRPLRDWGRFRWQDELLSVIWLYNRTGSGYLLDLAKLLRAQGFDWMAQFADFKYTKQITQAFLEQEEASGRKETSLSTHGVNNGQAIKTGPVWSVVSGLPADRAAAQKMLAELDRWHGLPNGMFSCDEHLSGPDPSQGTELCTVVEEMFSLEQALSIVGDAALADRLEKIAYNALPGTFDDAMWAHQYNQEPNQVECSLHHKPWVTDGPESNLFGLEPNFGCCTANFHQGWPKLVSSLFLMKPGEREGLVAAVYAPGTVKTVLNGTAVEIVEETEYPFRGKVHFTVKPETPTRFPLVARIPGWSGAGTKIKVNGESRPEPSQQAWAEIDRIWKAGDRVEIEFPMQPRVSRGFHNSAAIERGPLVFSLGIGEDWVKLREQGMAADWQVFPRSAWNYALALDQANPAASIDVAESEIGNLPFGREHAPVKLTVRARRLDDWRAEDGVALPVPESPVKSSLAEEKITLIPYAAAKLRVTAFPVLPS